MSPLSPEDRLKKLRFRAWRRGFVEADLILGPFADRHGRALDPGQLDRFEALLDQPDQDLYAWIVGLKPVPAEFDTDVMDLIRGFRFFAHEARDQSPA
jgi:antitoxin CptB